MKKKLNVILIKTVIFLLLINYQVVTVLFQDAFLLKYLRDIALTLLLVYVLVCRRKISYNETLIFIGVLIISILVAALQTAGLGVTLVFARRYLFPILFLYALQNSKELDKETCRDLLNFFLTLLAILGVWGIIQAHILGPSFLIKLGYPTIFSNAFQKITLRHSFYFGNLGIQRVVSTLSNSNLFALILGPSLILYWMDQEKLLVSKAAKVKFLIVLVTYILTFSRANFLAMLTVMITIAWKYIPQKRVIYLSLFIATVGVFSMFLVEGNSGIVHKLLGWVVRSLNFTDPSAGARFGIWKTAWEAVQKNSFGIGFGKVGSWAELANVRDMYICENSYLAMALDLGVSGTVFYTIFMFSLMIKIINKHNMNPRLSIAGVSICVYMMICFLFSNHIYDMEAVSSVYFLIALILTCLNMEK